MPRNPLLFSMMERMDLVEKVGTGILRMKAAMIEYGLNEPVIETDENSFSITFERDVQKSLQTDMPVNTPVNQKKRRGKMEIGKSKPFRMNSDMRGGRLKKTAKKASRPVPADTRRRHPKMALRTILKPS